MKLSEIAAALGCQIVGDESLDITGVSGMEQAGPSQLTFLANPKYAHKVKHSRAGAILVSQPLNRAFNYQLVSANPYLDFARALAIFYQPPARSREFIHSRSLHGRPCRRERVDRAIRLCG